MAWVIAAVVAVIKVTRLLCDITPLSVTESRSIHGVVYSTASTCWPVDRWQRFSAGATEEPRKQQQ